MLVFAFPLESFPSLSLWKYIVQTINVHRFVNCVYDEWAWG